MRGKLADRLFIHAGDDNIIFLGSHLEPGWNRNYNRMREAERKLYFIAFDLGLISDAFEDELLLKRLVYSGNHIGNMRGVSAPERVRL